MDNRKLKTSLLAVTVAAAIALSGTFAWQSIEQSARNEAELLTNPGGRLHDDYSGWDENGTKDIYVENFGEQPIYARIRLYEYMEVGQGAGLKSQDGGTTPNPKNKAVSLVTGAKIDDPTTWTVHLPGATAAATVTSPSSYNSTVTVTVPSSAAYGDTTTITATNSNDSTLTASFTVRTTDFAPIMTVDGIDWYVLVDEATITGKANGEETATEHRAALLLSKNVLELRQFDNSSPVWSTSAMRTYLNKTASGGWLNGKSAIQSKVVEVTIQTRKIYSSATSDGGTSDKIFLLSEPDLFGTANGGADTSPQSWEYTYNGAQLECFKTASDRIGTDSNGTARAWYTRSRLTNSTGICVVGSNGALSPCHVQYTTFYVRPAFWYNLDA